MKYKKKSKVKKKDLISLLIFQKKSGVKDIDIKDYIKKIEKDYK